MFQYAISDGDYVEANIIVPISAFLIGSGGLLEEVYFFRVHKLLRVAESSIFASFNFNKNQ